MLRRDALARQIVASFFEAHRREFEVYLVVHSTRISLAKLYITQEELESLSRLKSKVTGNSG